MIFNGSKPHSFCHDRQPHHGERRAAFASWQRRAVPPRWVAIRPRALRRLGWSEEKMTQLLGISSPTPAKWMQIVESDVETNQTLKDAITLNSRFNRNKCEWNHEDMKNHPDVHHYIKFISLAKWWQIARKNAATHVMIGCLTFTIYSDVAARCFELSEWLEFTQTGHL